MNNVAVIWVGSKLEMRGMGNSFKKKKKGFVALSSLQNFHIYFHTYQVITDTFVQ